MGDENFLVPTLMEFLFPQGKAVIYKISIEGVLTTYQNGFTTLVDIAKGKYKGALILKHGSFGPTGFTPNTKSLVWANATTATELKGGFNQPAGLKLTDELTGYITSQDDNKVLKVTE